MSSVFTCVVDTDRFCQHPQLHAPIPPASTHECHDHQHRHHHSHGEWQAGPARPHQERALRLSLLISAVMMVIELFVGWVTGSLLLLSDAVHMLSHILALGVGLAALRLANRPCGDHLPFGLYRVEVLGALLNGLLLAAMSLWIVLEAVERVIDPVQMRAAQIIPVAAIGLLVNLGSALILFRAGAEDLNTRGVWYHLIADGASSILVLLGAVVCLVSGWSVVDPLLSVIVALFIGKWSLSLLSDAVCILLERKPDNIDLTHLEVDLCREFPEIRQIHDLHVWEITSHYVCLSAHVVIEDRPLSATHQLRTSIASRLQQRFGIGHAVIQFESRSLTSDLSPPAAMTSHDSPFPA